MSAVCIAQRERGLNSRNSQKRTLNRDCPLDRVVIWNALEGLAAERWSLKEVLVQLSVTPCVGMSFLFVASASGGPVFDHALGRTSVNGTIFSQVDPDGAGPMSPILGGATSTSSASPTSVSGQTGGGILGFPGVLAQGEFEATISESFLPGSRLFYTATNRSEFSVTSPATGFIQTSVIVSLFITLDDPMMFTEVSTGDFGIIDIETVSGEPGGINGNILAAGLYNIRIPLSGRAGTGPGEQASQELAGTYTLDLLPLGTVIPLPTGAALSLPLLSLGALARPRRR